MFIQHKNIEKSSISIDNIKNETAARQPSTLCLAEGLSLASRSSVASGSTVSASSLMWKPTSAILWDKGPVPFLEINLPPLTLEEHRAVENWVSKFHRQGNDVNKKGYTDSIKYPLSIDGEFKKKFFNIILNQHSRNAPKTIIDSIITVEKEKLGAAYNTSKLSAKNLFFLGVGLSRVDDFFENRKSLKMAFNASESDINSVLLSGISILYRDAGVPPIKLDGFYNDYQYVPYRRFPGKIASSIQDREKMGEGPELRRFLADWAPMQRYLSHASPELAQHLKSLSSNDLEARSAAQLAAVNSLMGPISQTSFEKELRDFGPLKEDSSKVYDLADKVSEFLDSGGVNPKWVHALYRWNLEDLATAAGDSSLLSRLKGELS